MDTLKLDMAVGLLTRPSKHRLTDGTGVTQWVTADPLLVQLSIAVGNSSASAVFKSSTGNPLPLSAEAHDLLERIKEEAAAHWWQTHTLHKGVGRVGVGAQIRAWAMAARTNEQLLAEAEKILTAWVQDIQNLFAPAREAEIQGACPKCGARRILDREEDGHHFMKPALVMVYDRDGVIVEGARCGACKETWPREGVMLLARIIATQKDEEDNGGDAA